MVTERLRSAWRRSDPLAVALVCVMVVLFAFTPESDSAGAERAFHAAGWTLVAILLGRVVLARRQMLDTYAERAVRAEAERDAEAERRVAEERIRIARELHDLLAHTVSVMTVQAGVAADSLERRPEAARAAIDVIRSAGRDAMGEIRATVAVLRGGGAADGAGGGNGTAPAPGLARLDELVASATAAGLAVELQALPPGTALPPVVELTAYRVVQEALTNVLRHARASRAEVRLELTGESLVVAVSDNGVAPLAAGPPARGFGLRGMAERVESLGGSLRYGPRPEGGFAVRAVLPVGGLPVGGRPGGRAGG